MMDLYHYTDELKKLIAENPDLPICVIAGEEANTGDCNMMFCSSVSFEIGEILDCVTPYRYRSDDVECDRDDFEERLEEWLWDEMSSKDLLGNYIEPSEEEFQKALAEEKAKYEPYWKKCIMIYANN